ncbi:MAG: hypothetical protein JWN15_2147 [Firmicutes bacterium]|nr:hypothetical protein [Bacillota bacterium]
MGTALMHTGDLFQAEAQLQQFLTIAAAVGKLRWFAGDALFNMAHLKRALGQGDHAALLFDEAAQAYEAAGRLGQVPGCTYEIGWGLVLAGSSEKALPYLETASSALPESDEPELAVKLDIARALHDSLIGALERSNHTCRAVLTGHDVRPEQVADCEWILGRNAVIMGDFVAAALHADSAYAAAVRYWWPPQLDRINALKAEIAGVTSMGR